MKYPSNKTLAKYGLDPFQFKALWDKHKGLCHMGCGKELDKGMVFIDHEHVKGYAKLSPENRASHVRGLLCYMCNRFKVCKNTEKDLGRLVTYLSKGMTSLFSSESLGDVWYITLTHPEEKPALLTLVPSYTGARRGTWTSGEGRE